MHSILLSSGELLNPIMQWRRVRGRARTLLECERICLNFIQRLYGMATLARKYVDAVAGTRCKVLDTRKTTPGLRRLESLQRRAGGVTNHRFGLFDAVLIKNNHITAAGGVRPALERIRQARLLRKYRSRSRSALGRNSMRRLAAGARHVLLDNLTPKQAAAEIEYIAGRAKVELSGNITLDTFAPMRPVAPTSSHAGRSPIRPGPSTSTSESTFFDLHARDSSFSSLHSTMHKAAELARLAVRAARSSSPTNKPPAKAVSDASGTPNAGSDCICPRSFA